MRRAILTILFGAALAATAGAAEAQGRSAGRGHWGEAQALRFQLGLFEPRGDSAYWDDKALDFTGDASDFEDAWGGVSYVRFLGPRLGVTASGTFFGASETQHYLDFVDGAGREIVHETTLDTAAFTVGMLLHLTRRDRAIVPYVGAGTGLYFWELTEIGDFIDFPGGGDIFFGDFQDDGVAWGWYFQAGLEAPIARNWSVFLDARWDRADDDLGSDFAGLGELDLSGKALSLGAAVSF